MRVLARWVAVDTGDLIDERITTLREVKDDNANMPAQWVIVQDIRDNGKFETVYGYSHLIRMTLTKVPRRIHPS